MSEGYTGPRWQLYRFDKLYPYRYHTNIPERIKGQVCLCRNWEGFDLKTEKGKRFPSCKNCGRLMHYLIHKCTKCGDVFIKNFKHVDFCPLDPQCWVCLNDLMDDRCKHLKERLFDSYTREPLVKVRKFTAEELSDLDLDFKF